MISKPAKKMNSITFTFLVGIPYLGVLLYVSLIWLSYYYVGSVKFETEITNGAVYLWRVIVMDNLIVHVVNVMLLLVIGFLHLMPSLMINKKAKNKKQEKDYLNLQGYKKHKLVMVEILSLVFIVYGIVETVFSFIRWQEIAAFNHQGLLNRIIANSQLGIASEEFLNILVAEYIGVVFIVMMLSTLLLSYIVLFGVIVLYMVIIQTSKSELRAKAIEAFEIEAYEDGQRDPLGDNFIQLCYLVTNVPYCTSFSMPARLGLYDNEVMVIDNFEHEALKEKFKGFSEYVGSTTRHIAYFLGNSIEEMVDALGPYFRGELQEWFIQRPDVNLYIIIYRQLLGSEEAKESFKQLEKLCEEISVKLVFIDSRDDLRFDKLLKLNSLPLEGYYKELKRTRCSYLGSYGSFPALITIMLRKAISSDDLSKSVFIFYDIIDVTMRLALFNRIAGNDELIEEYGRSQPSEYHYILTTLGAIDDNIRMHMDDDNIRLDDLLVETDRIAEFLDCDFVDDVINLRGTIGLYNIIRNKTRGHGVITEDIIQWLYPYLSRTFLLLYYGCGLDSMKVVTDQGRLWLDREEGRVSLEPLMRLHDETKEIVMLSKNLYMDYVHGDYFKPTLITE